MAKYSLIPFLMLFALLSSACASPPAAPPTLAPTVAVVIVPNSTTTPTALPTNTPAPLPTASPTPTPFPTPTLAPRPPFDGAFSGVINGDAGSSATVSVDLTQTGTALNGTATLGEGLLVDVGGGFCPGVQDVPATAMELNTETNPANPRHLEESSKMVVRGFDIGVTMMADVSEDGNVMNVRMDLIMPWPCRSVTLQAALAKTE